MFRVATKKKSPSTDAKKEVHILSTSSNPQKLSKSPPKFPKSLHFYSVPRWFISEMCQSRKISELLPHTAHPHFDRFLPKIPVSNKKPQNSLQMFQKSTEFPWISKIASKCPHFVEISTLMATLIPRISSRYLVDRCDSWEIPLQAYNLSM